MTSNRRLNCYVRYPDWSPTGDFVYYELAETTGNLWIAERGPQTGEETAGGKR